MKDYVEIRSEQRFQNARRSKGTMGEARGHAGGPPSLLSLGADTPVSLLLVCTELPWD